MPTENKLDRDLASAMQALDEKQARSLITQGANINALVYGPVKILIYQPPYSSRFFYVETTVLGQAIHDRTSDREQNPGLNTQRVILALKLGADIIVDTASREEFGSFLCHVMGELPVAEFSDLLELPGVKGEAERVAERLLERALWARGMPGGESSYFGDKGKYVLENAAFLIENLGFTGTLPGLVKEIIQSHCRWAIDADSAYVKVVDEAARQRLEIALRGLTYDDPNHLMAHMGGPFIQRDKKLAAAFYAVQLIKDANRLGGLAATASLLEDRVAEDLAHLYLEAYKFDKEQYNDPMIDAHRTAEQQNRIFSPGPERTLGGLIRTTNIWLENRPGA